MTHDPQIPVAVRLAALTPAATDSQVVLSAQQCGVDLRERLEHKFSYERPDGSIAPARSVAFWSACAETVEQVDAARRRLNHSLTPPSHDQAVGWIAELSVITARRLDDDMTEDLRAAAYSRRLSEYPADIARHALLVHRWKFFPTWAELAEVCDALLEPRRKMQAALDAAERDARERELKARALPDESTAIKTPEERAAVAASVGDLIAGINAKAAAERAKAEAEAKTDPDLTTPTA